MNRFVAGIICALAAAHYLRAATNSVGTNVASVAVTNSADTELEQIMEADDAALDEVDKWIRDNQTFAAKGAGESKEDLNKRIRAKLETIRKGYQDFLKRNPDSARGHLAYGTFINDIGDEELALAEFETARKLDPTNPAAWNNCANYYGEHGPTTNAFVYYAKAIDLNSNE
ncbi:MAG TPA: hypothetical protein VN516_01920, partial [Candidatus Baltobacteraceae bacterium]|nr:hypothetical protein [Candidatus Baltobacteraceae bacterium]